MKWPQIVLLILYAFGLGVAAVKHGEPRDNYNFWTTLFATVIEILLLYWGGFWG